MRQGFFHNRKNMHLNGCWLREKEPFSKKSACLARIKNNLVILKNEYKTTLVNNVFS